MTDNTPMCWLCFYNFLWILKKKNENTEISLHVRKWLAKTYGDHVYYFCDGLGVCSSLLKDKQEFLYMLENGWQKHTETMFTVSVMA